MPFHWMMPAYNWIALITTTIIMAISAFPYWKSAIAAFKKHSANMNTPQTRFITLSAMKATNTEHTVINDNQSKCRMTQS